MKRCPTCQSRYRDGVMHCPFDGAALGMLDDPLLGRVISGRYLIEKKLGAGGMATVYKGRHQTLDHEVAIKVLHAQLAADAEYRQRFLREARAANRVVHENVVDILDTGETDDGVVYLVMEYLRGLTLAEHVHRGRLSVTRASHIGHQIARALARAHALGVVHRDVKPDNVLIVNRDGDADFVKLLDFGIARSLGDLALTKSNHVFGTPAYMAPEQIDGGDIGPATDLYGLGCLLFEILTGDAPFKGQMLELYDQHLNAAPPRLLTLRPDAPPALDALIHQLLEKSPARRPVSAYRVAHELAGLLGSVPPPRSEAFVAPASEAPASARPLSALHAEDRLWQAHVEELGRRGRTAYAGAPLPPWLADTFTRMQGLVEQLRMGRDQFAALSRTSQKAGTHTHETSLRIGHALDALQAHDLALIERLTDCEQRLQQAERLLAPHATALLAAAEQLDTRPSARAGMQGPSLLALVQSWGSMQRAVLELHAQCARLRSEREDLGFQIGQLKGRLGAGHAASEASGGELAKLETSLETELRAKIYALRLDADRVSEHLTQRLS